MSFKETMKITPVVIDHWKYKFERSIKILLKSGYQVDDLIKELKEIASSEYEKNKNDGTTVQ